MKGEFGKGRAGSEHLFPVPIGHPNRLTMERELDLMEVAKERGLSPREVNAYKRDVLQFREGVFEYFHWGSVGCQYEILGCSKVFKVV